MDLSDPAATDSITVLDAFGAAIQATTLVGDKGEKTITLGGLPGVMAAYVKYCTEHRTKPLASGYLLTDVLFKSEDLTIPLYCDEKPEQVLQVVTRNRDKNDLSWRRHIVEQVKDRDSRSVKYNLIVQHMNGLYRRSYNWVDTDLPGAPPLGKVHKLRIQKRQKSPRYCALTPTVIAFIALKEIGLDRDFGTHENYTLCMLLRVIWAFESEASAQQIEKYWLVTRDWSFAQVCGHPGEGGKEVVDAIEAGLRKLQDEELHRKLAAWEVERTGWDRTQVQECYRAAFKGFSDFVEEAVKKYWKKNPDPSSPGGRSFYASSSHNQSEHELRSQFVPQARLPSESGSGGRCVLQRMRTPTQGPVAGSAHESPLLSKTTSPVGTDSSSQAQTASGPSLRRAASHPSSDVQVVWKDGARGPSLTTIPSMATGSTWPLARGDAATQEEPMSAFEEDDDDEERDRGRGDRGMAARLAEKALDVYNRTKSRRRDGNGRRRR